MLTPYKKFISILLAAGLCVVGIVSVWDYLSGSEEKWIHYVNPDDPKILGEYSSNEECSKYMDSHEGPSGCRRVDGPYNAINELADIVL